MSLARTLDPFLEAVIPAVRRVERFLGPEDDWVEDDRRILFEATQRHLGHLHAFAYEKGAAEYVTTAKCSPDEFERTIMPPYQRNLASARKYRTYHGGGKQWACGSFVIDGLEGDDGYVEQHHVYIFETADGYTDVHTHRETSVTEGAEHLTDSHQDDADPRDLFGILDRAGIEYEHRNY